MKKDLQKIFNKDSFIYNYLECCKNLETSQDYDLWGAIWIVSLLINRNIMINRPNNPLYPNFYITIIDNNGGANRSLATTFADSVINKIIDKEDEIEFITSTCTFTRLNYLLGKLSNMNDKCIVGINSNEFIYLYNNKQMITYFNELFDCPTDRRSYGTDNIILRNVFISSFTGSTTNNYFKAVSKDEIEDGYMCKNIIIFSNKPKRKIAWESEYIEYDKLYTFGKQIKSNISKYKGSINLSPEAIRHYTSWYKRRRLRSNLYNKFFECKEQDFILKLATIIAVNNNKLEIDLDCIKNAMDYISFYKQKTYKFLNNEINHDDRLVKIINKIRKYIHEKASDGIKHRELYMHIHNTCTREEFNYILSMLHELNMIELLQPLNSKAIIYRELPSLMTGNIDKIIENFD